MTLGTAFYLLLVSTVGAERLFELWLSRRNATVARSRGGVEAESRAFYALMVLFHTLFLAAAALEPPLLARPFRPALAVVATLVVTGAMALRYWAVVTLGWRWNSRVIVVPGEPAETGGPYRYLRHPNYLALIFEIAALPLVHGAWWTALAGTIGNGLLLVARVRHEERALAAASDYFARLGDRSRLLPGAPKP